MGKTSKTKLNFIEMFRQIFTLAALSSVSLAAERYFTAKLKGNKNNGYQDVTGYMIGRHTDPNVAFTEIDIDIESEVPLGALYVELIWIDLDAGVKFKMGKC